MRSLIVLILIMHFGIACGQTKVYNIPSSKTGDIAYWHKYQDGFITKIGLQRIDTISDGKYFRINTGREVVDLWQRTDKQIEGQVTIWAYETTKEHEKPTFRIFVDHYPIQKDSANAIVQVMIAENILDIPAGDSIPSWNQNWYDCNTYSFEYSTKGKYTYKNYSCPEGQNGLNEVRNVTIFFKRVLVLASVDSFFSKFTNKVPFECFSLSNVNCCRGLTKKQRKQYYKERQQYRKEHFIEVPRTN